MDERSTHEDDELLDTDSELEDTTFDDETTPADTDEESDEPKKADAAEVKARQKAAWLKKAEKDPGVLDKMPANLGWLKKEIKEEMKPVKEEKADGLSDKIRKALQEERAQEEYDALIDDLQSSEITAEQDARLREEYEDLISDFQNPTAAQKLKALTNARRLVGIKSNSDTILERRRRGRALPPLGGRRRETVEKDKLTEMEKRLGGNLPPGFKA